MSLKSILLTCCFIVYVYNVGFAQTGGVGTYKFLEKAGSARSASLGEKNISVSDGDLNMVANNPALLTESSASKLALNYLSYYADISMGYAAYSLKQNSKASLAAGIQYINYGSFDGRDVVGNATSSFNATDMALNIFYSRPIDSAFRIGVTVKPLLSYYERYSSMGIAFDAGATYTIDEGRLTFAAVIRNVGTQIKPYVSGKYEDLPFEAMLGISQRLHHAPFRISLTLHSLQRYEMTYDDIFEKENSFGETASDSKAEKFMENALRHAIIGVEFLPSKSFFINGSFNYQRRKEMMLLDAPGATGFAFGGGLNLRKFSFCYSYSQYFVSGGAHTFSLQLNLGPRE
jgi:hypothetical protein